MLSNGWYNQDGDEEEGAEAEGPKKTIGDGKEEAGELGLPSTIRLTKEDFVVGKDGKANADNKAPDYSLAAAGDLSLAGVS